MSPGQPNGSAFAYRLTKIETTSDKHGGRLDGVEDLAAKHEVELHGEMGIYYALGELATQLKWTQRALWGLAASLLVVALTLALTSGAG